MRCIFGSKMYAITLMLFLGKCEPCLKRYWNNSPSCYHSLHSKWHFLLVTLSIFNYNQTVAWPYASMLCIFFENGFLKRKLKLKLSFALFQRQHIIGSRTHRHISTEMLSDENGTNAPVRPTLSSTRSSVPAKFLSTWSRSVAYYICIRRSLKVVVVMHVI